MKSQYSKIIPYFPSFHINKIWVYFRVKNSTKYFINFIKLKKALTLLASQNLYLTLRYHAAETEIKPEASYILSLTLNLGISIKIFIPKPRIVFFLFPANGSTNPDVF